MDPFRILEAQNGSPAVEIDGGGAVVDCALQHKGDLVKTFLQRNAEAAIFHRESTIGCTAFIIGLVEVFAPSDKFPIDEHPDVAEPAKLDEFVLRCR